MERQHITHKFKVETEIWVDVHDPDEGLQAVRAALRSMGRVTPMICARISGTTTIELVDVSS